MRRTAVAAAGFTSAQPNFGHEILALLLLEGVVVVITTNWDDCIERAGRDERVLAVISDQERLQIQTPALLKVHGCATRPTTALITTQDLATPPPWARDEVNARLAASHTAFVGIGDVAGYVRKRIQEAADAVGPDGATSVASPGISSNWDGSQWAEILPDLAEDRRVAVTADSFLDHLAAACIRRALREISEALVDESAIRTTFELARAAFELRTSLEALRWLRSCAFPRSAGASAIREQAFATALIALGSLADETDLRFDSDAKAVTPSIEYEVLVAIGTVSASSFRREVTQRLVRRRSEGAKVDDPVFLISGAVGRADTRGTGTLPTDVLDDPDASDLVSGPLAVVPEIVHAEDCSA